MQQSLHVFATIVVYVIQLLLHTLFPCHRTGCLPVLSDVAGLPLPPLSYWGCKGCSVAFANTAFYGTSMRLQSHPAGGHLPV